MSIFPKRAIPGETVTIHWNFNTSNLTDFHVIPWVRIGVQSPDGETSMLFEDHVLGLPEERNEPKTDAPKLKYLNKNVPLLLLADFLSGKQSKEKLIEVLENIQSGRHYYFTYQIPQNAPLGKYHLMSEIYVNGELRLSKTAADDFFFVENISCNGCEKSGDKMLALVFNHSEEKTPVKIAHCYPSGGGKIKTVVDVFEMDGLEERAVPLVAPFNFLLYNEERQVIPLHTSTGFLLRNQQVAALSKKEHGTYLFKQASDEGYHLDESQKGLWEKADGLLSPELLAADERQLAEEMIAENLIQSLSFTK